MNSTLLDQIEKFISRQPELKYEENGQSFIISGRYRYSLETEDVVFQDSREIKLVVSKNFPKSIPEFFVYDIPKGIDHIYQNNSTCLATTGELIQFLITTPKVEDFIDKFINAFIFTMDWYKKYNSYPFGERKHGFRGLLDYYLNDWKLTKSQYFSLVDIIAKKKYRGHNLCICESGKIFRNCHGKNILPIIMNDEYYSLFLREAIMIMKEDNINGK